MCVMMQNMMQISRFFGEKKNQKKKAKSVFTKNIIHIERRQKTLRYAQNSPQNHRTRYSITTTATNYCSSSSSEEEEVWRRFSRSLFFSRARGVLSK
jgi:hypothetical protein